MIEITTKEGIEELRNQSAYTKYMFYSIVATG